jgi:hypothetical protein
MKAPASGKRSRRKTARPITPRQRAHDSASLRGNRDSHRSTIKKPSAFRAASLTTLTKDSTRRLPVPDKLSVMRSFPCRLCCCAARNQSVASGCVGNARRAETPSWFLRSQSIRRNLRRCVVSTLTGLWQSPGHSRWRPSLAWPGHHAAPPAAPRRHPPIRQPLCCLDTLPAIAGRASHRESVVFRNIADRAVR